MSELETKVPLGDDLSREIRDRVKAAQELARHLNEASVHARQVLLELRPALQDASAYIHRETGLDVLVGYQAPVGAAGFFADDHDHRVTIETHEVVIPTFPATLFQCGCQVSAGTEGSLRIIPYWVVGSLTDPDSYKLIHEVVVGRIGGSEQATAVAQATHILLTSRQIAAERLLLTLREI